MRIEYAHSLGQQQAESRLDGFLEQLMRDPPGGVTLEDADRAWDGNRMRFRFTARRGMFGAAITGQVTVTDDVVVLETDLPPLLKGFLGEDRVREAVSRELGRVLSCATERR